jgi:hypothetical protein
VVLIQAFSLPLPRSRRLWLLSLLALLVFLVSAVACGTPAAAPEEAISTGTAFDSQADSSTAHAGLGNARPAQTVQSPDDALSQDLGLAAQAHGWTIEEATADHEASEIVGRIAGQIAAEWPDIFVGSALSAEPGGVATLYIKGPADEFVRNLVANAEIEIKLVDNQPYSSDELEQRQLQVTQAIQARGYSNFGVGFDITDRGHITAELTRQPGLPDDPAAVLASLQESVRPDVTITFSDIPVAVDQ